MALVMVVAVAATMMARPSLTNSLQTGSLQVTKVVDWNGALPQNPTFEICIQGPTYPNGDETGACQNATGPTGATLTWVDIEVGDYTVSETDPGERWTTEISDSPVTVETAQTAQATITNTHAAPGGIYIRKVVPAGEGDPANPGQTFALSFVDSDASRTVGGSFPAGTGFQGMDNLAPVTWTVREQNIPTNWTLDDIDCTSQNGTSVIEDFVTGRTSVNVELASGDRVECTYINSFNPPTGNLTIVKAATPEDGTDFAFTSNIPGGDRFTLDVDSDGTYSDTITFNNLAVGSYAITEILPTSWQLDSASCTGGSDGGNLSGEILSVALGTGENVTCTFTNSQEPTGNLTIIKAATPEDGTDFAFTSNIPGGDRFTLDVDSDGTYSDTITFNNLAVGSYAITEILPTSWQLDSASCTGGSDGGNLSGEILSVALGTGENVTCTFTNSQEPTGNLTIIKAATPEDGTDFAFTSNIPGGDSFTLDDASPDDSDGVDQSITFNNLAVGSYTITETLPTDWQLNQATCTGGSDSGSLSDKTLSVALGVGENVTCTFNNEVKRALLKISIEALGLGPNTFFNFTTVNLNPSQFMLGDGETQSFPNLIPGQSYTVKEQPPTGWILDSIVCSEAPPICETGSITVTPEPGQTIDATFRFRFILHNIPVLNIWGLMGFISLLGFIVAARVRRR